MKRPHRSAISAKIEIDKDKIYRVSDPIQLSEVFFPSKNANQKRAAFLAIFFEIKNASRQRLPATDYIAKEYGLSQSAVTKARTKMTRIGLIKKRGSYWSFSTTFATSLHNLKEKIVSYQSPAQSTEQAERERLFVEIAKGVQRH
jgi:hypothetical protein